MAPKKDRPEHLNLVGAQEQNTAPPPKLLEHIQNSAIESALRLLEQMFSATDDLFYDLSKRATSNNEQNLYFESMREIRIKKRGVASAFAHEVNSTFSALMSNHPKADRTEHEDDANSLSIVEGDDLEVELALNNMTSRSRDLYKQELYELIIRMDHLMMQARIDEENCPIDPQQLSAAFISACSNQLSISIKARLILFKLFEKHVLKQLGHIYSDANQLLMEAGILPKVPRNLNKSRSAIPPGSADPDADNAGQMAAEQSAFAQEAMNFQLDLNALSTLMASARACTNTIIGENTKPAGPYTYYLYASNPGPIMASPQLSALLTKSQPLVDRQLATVNPRNVISDVITQLLAKRDPEVPQALEQPDEDIINLIAMFFDNVLSDENLPIAVQSLICRLQIPILKIALRDRSLLTDTEHPARQLINQITKAGLSFDENKPLERDPLYRKIADGVQTINRLYKADVSVFEGFLHELEEEMNKEYRKSALVEKRTTQAEEGKSKIRLARTTAQNALYNKLKHVQLPEAVSNFLTNTWLQVLVITHLKSGYDSDEWVEAENLVGDIIWLCQQHNDPKSLARKKHLQPEVLERIENGLEIAIDNPETRTSKVTAIEEVLVSLGEPESPHIDFIDLTEDQKDVLGKADPEQKPWEEMTALERQQTRYEELSNHYYLEAKEIPEGVWLEYGDEEKNKQMRCKLSSKVDADSYIFVNRFGFKVLEKSRTARLRPSIR